MRNELIALGGAFVAAGLLARLGRRIGLPTIPFFILAGILTGPQTPGLVLVGEEVQLELFASIGLILLLFHLGLEFSLGDLTGGGTKLLKAGGSYLVLHMAGGLILGFLIGWGTKESFVIAGVVGISSSAIVTKLLVELKRLANKETGMILGIIVFQDVFMALYLAMLQPILRGAEGAGEMLFEFGRAFLFLIVLLAVTRYGARYIGRLLDSEDDELLTVLFIGFAILIGGIAEEFGVSDAIGALMAGLLVAETSVAPRVQRLVLPLRDAFGAVFFFAFGLTIDPGEVSSVAVLVGIAVAVTIVMNVMAGIIGARVYGFGKRAAANAGLTLVGRGEFSLILATFAVAAGVDARIAPFTALYVLVLAVLGPLLASESHLLARLLPERLFVRRISAIEGL